MVILALATWFCVCMILFHQLQLIRERWKLTVWQTNLGMVPLLLVITFTMRIIWPEHVDILREYWFMAGVVTFAALIAYDKIQLHFRPRAGE